jgi:hypothetical protein
MACVALLVRIRDFSNRLLLSINSADLRSFINDTHNADSSNKTVVIMIIV